MHHLARDVRRHRRTAPDDFLDRLQNLRALGTLQQIPRRTRLQRTKDVLGVLVGGEHDDVRLGQNLFQFADTLHAVHAGEIDVHQHHARFVIRKPDERRLGVTILPDALIARRAIDDAGKGAAQIRIVLDDGDGDRHGLGK